MRGVRVWVRSHLAAVYGVEVSPDLISNVTDAVVGELAAWQNRPLNAVWLIIYVDALWVKNRSGAVVRWPVYVAVGVERGDVEPGAQPLYAEGVPVVGDALEAAHQ